MSEPDESFAGQSMATFRQRIDALFADARTTSFRGTELAGFPQQAIEVLNRRVADTLTSLGAAATSDSLRLRRSLIMHDGQIVAMAGDHVSLEPDENVQVVTTVTTVLTSKRMRTETMVLVFDLAHRTV